MPAARETARPRSSRRIRKLTSTHRWGTQPDMFGPRLLHRLGLILNALGPLPPQSRILDAACGLGQLLDRLQQRGVRAIGIDGEIAAAIHAHRTTGASVVVG